MKLVEVFGVRVELPTNQPIVLLREVNGDRYIPIWVGAGEASAISFAQQGIQATRPLTHDLILDLLDAFDQKLQQIEITSLVDGVFHAIMKFESGTEVSSRPSDAIAVALKFGVPIYCHEEVIEVAGVAVDEGADDDAQVEAFREFLDQITPEDFS